MIAEEGQCVCQVDGIDMVVVNQVVEGFEVVSEFHIDHAKEQVGVFGQRGAKHALTLLLVRDRWL